MLRIIFTLIATLMFIFGCTTPPAPKVAVEDAGVKAVEDAAKPASAPASAPAR